MNDLFSNLDANVDSMSHSGNANAPLAERLRPKSIDEVIGQAHLLGPGKPIRVSVESSKPHSMLFWGPPGVGKTTLARLMAGAFGLEFIALSAVLSGVKEIREAIEHARMNLTALSRGTILFVDEVHRFNKSQQDAFLPHVESGLVTFIGATTENPSFEVNGALLSRAQVYVLESLTQADLTALAMRGAKGVAPDMVWDNASFERIAQLADGDGRRLLNLVEQLAYAGVHEGIKTITPEFVERIVQRSNRRFDKGGEEFYNQISALHKAVRGSDPDAALYWFCRMMDGGADPRYAARRIVRMASEDIGLADPRGLRMALDAAETYERLGSPEGELALAQCVIYLAIAAKSNAAYVAYNQARAFIAKDDSRPVPMHLRNAPTKLMKDLDYGKGYRYAHDEAEGFAAGEDYWPTGLDAQRWYQPVDRGMESRIKEKLDGLAQRNQAAPKKRKSE